MSENEKPPQTEANAKIAEWMGWRKVEVYEWSGDGKTRLPKQYHVDHHGEAFGLPNYFSNSLPVETRLEILAKLTVDEMEELIDLVCRTDTSLYRNGERLFKLDQPTLAELVCKIKGWI